MFPPDVSELDVEALSRAKLEHQKQKKKLKKLKKLEDTLWGHVTQYEIIVKTSNVRGAGTEANVVITLYGVDADTGEIPLEVNADTGGDKFERDAQDIFVVNAMWVGSLQKLRVGHDAKGLGAGWHLERITVHDCLGRTFYFPCNQWIDVGYASKKKQIFRELAPFGEFDTDQVLTAAFHTENSPQLLQL